MDIPDFKEDAIKAWTNKHPNLNPAYWIAERNEFISHFKTGAIHGYNTCIEKEVKPLQAQFDQSSKDSLAAMVELKQEIKRLTILGLDYRNQIKDLTGH
jgi:hypothetical protein